MNCNHCGSLSCAVALSLVGLQIQIGIGIYFLYLVEQYLKWTTVERESLQLVAGAETQSQAGARPSIVRDQAGQDVLMPLDHGPVLLIRKCVQVLSLIVRAAQILPAFVVTQIPHLAVFIFRF